MKHHVHKVLSGEYAIEGLQLESPTVLDIGANVGSFSYWARNTWPKSIIHCYEPHPTNFEFLQQNLSKLTGVVLRPAGVSDHTGPQKLYDGAHNCGEASLYKIGEQSDSTHTVNVVSADSLPSCDVLKIDTEGSEWPILSTYRYLDTVTAVMLEWHSLADRQKISDLLSQRGFSLYEDNQWSPERGVMKWTKGVDVKPKKGVDPSTINLLIGMPCYGGMTHFSNNQSLIELHDMLNAYKVRHDPRYLPGDSLIPRARNYFGTMCMCDPDPHGNPYSHLLFTDVDIRYSARDIISLLALDKDIAALPYSAKDFDWAKIVQAVKKGVEDPETLRRCAGRPIINAHEATTFNCNEAVQFPQLGTGLLLIKRKVFEVFAEKEPQRKYKLMRNETTNGTRDFAYDFFQSGVNPETRYYDSEDYRFCLDARKLGFQTWLWPNAVTWHTGSYSFCMDVATQAMLGIHIVGKEEEVKELQPLLPASVS